MDQQKQTVLVHALFQSDSPSSSSLDQSDGADDVLSSSNGPLYELSQLMDHLPVKRGISKFYSGKSQSFASLGDAESSAEDLGKKGRCYNRRMKWSKSFVGINRKFGPKPVIAKRLSPGRLLPLTLSSYPPSSDGMGALSTLLAFHA